MLWHNYGTVPLARFHGPGAEKFDAHRVELLSTVALCIH